eukprot:TRINITY_DN23083_c0_g1_i1.p1 TRINITY_DN23083_c0_g1~~TRINITY_DN23083_c0_g1_i1.p1  ORF type:complete len:309 (-),score=19.12 TRINITY_DN23083_c0_g1_i1:140-1066(-)
MVLDGPMSRAHGHAATTLPSGHGGGFHGEPAARTPVRHAATSSHLDHHVHSTPVTPARHAASSHAAPRQVTPSSHHHHHHGHHHGHHVVSSHLSQHSSVPVHRSSVSSAPFRTSNYHGHDPTSEDLLRSGNVVSERKIEREELFETGHVREDHASANHGPYPRGHQTVETADRYYKGTVSVAPHHSLGGDLGPRVVQLPSYESSVPARRHVDSYTSYSHGTHLLGGGSETRAKVISGGIGDGVHGSPARVLGGGGYHRDISYGGTYGGAVPSPSVLGGATLGSAATPYATTSYDAPYRGGGGHVATIG